MISLNHKIDFLSKEWKCSKCGMFLGQWQQEPMGYYVFEKYTRLTCDECVIKNIIE